MKKSTLFRLSAIALGLCANAVYANEYSQVIIFGDSLSDTGRIKELVNQEIPALGGLLQPSFTTNPDPVWTSLLAEAYGKTAIANTAENPNGTNYAVGGSQSARTATWGGTPVQIPTTNEQITQYLDKHNQKADPNALYAVWIGANDLFYAIEHGGGLAHANKAVTATVEGITNLHQAGATTILVPNIPDLSLTPLIHNTAPNAKPQVQLLTQMYNKGVLNALNQSNANIIPANTFALLQEAYANKEAFGLSDVTGTACKETLPIPHTSSSLACNKTKLVSPNANDTHMFADLIHPSGKTHRILAQYYRSIIDSPAQMGQLSQKILNTGSTNDRHLYRRLNQLTGDKHSVWADIHVGDDSPLTTIGMDIAGQNHHTGAYISHQNQDYQLSNTLTADTKNVGFGVYHRHDVNKIRLNAKIGVDVLSADIQRHIAWEGENRTHNAKTDARRFHGGIQAGYALDVNKLTVRPYVGVNTQKVRVDALAENNAHLSTAMQFGKQDIKSLQGELGLDVDYAIRPNMTLTGGISHAHEFKDNPRTMNATLLSIPEYARGFNTPVVSDKVHATTAHVGITSQLKSATIGAGTYIIRQDGKHDNDTQAGGKLSVAWKF